MKITILCSIM